MGTSGSLAAHYSKVTLPRFPLRAVWGLVFGRRLGEVAWPTKGLKSGQLVRLAAVGQRPHVIDFKAPSLATLNTAPLVAL